MAEINLNPIDYVQEDGKPLPSRIINELVQGLNETKAWIQEFQADHPTGSDISQARVIGLKNTYEFSGEEVTPNVTLYLGGKMLKYGEDFTADYENNDGIGTATVTYLGLFPFSGEITKTFAIEGKKYNVTYETDYGTAPSARKVSVLTANELPELTNEDYSFVGWYDEGGKKYTTGEVLNSDVHLIAHWVAKTFTLTYESAHGIVTQPTGKVSALPSSLQNPEAEGYHFAGWYYENGTKANGNDILREDTTLYAKWVNRSVYFDINVDDTTHESTLTFSADEQTEEVTIEYSEDGGETWQEPTSTPIELSATKSYLVRLKYGYTVIATSADATITAINDNDANNLTFSSNSGTVINTATSEAVGTIDFSTDIGTYSLTDGVTTATVIITNN